VLTGEFNLHCTAYTSLFLLIHYPKKMSEALFLSVLLSAPKSGGRQIQVLEQQEIMVISTFKYPLILNIMALSSKLF
jgi:hypothetical protein